MGWKDALAKDPGLRKGANVVDGKVVYQPVADAFGMDYTPIEEFLNI